MCYQEKININLKLNMTKIKNPTKNTYFAKYEKQYIHNILHCYSVEYSKYWNKW